MLETSIVGNESEEVGLVQFPKIIYRDARIRILSVSADFFLVRPAYLH